MFEVIYSLYDIYYIIFALYSLINWALLYMARECFHHQCVEARIGPMKHHMNSTHSSYSIWRHRWWTFVLDQIYSTIIKSQSQYDKWGKVSDIWKRKSVKINRWYREWNRTSSDNPSNSCPREVEQFWTDWMRAFKPGVVESTHSGRQNFFSVRSFWSVYYTTIVVRKFDGCNRTR